ncbi:nucleotidyltransferase family protein [uncultured Winogradskyella sp.]|uniref:nucleotidyltransferase family protein n=1 Tax=uncultured Winogradskyella sp. TaxID=395353 RepID=UPI0035119A76
MAQRLETYRAIAKILSPETKASELETILQHPDFDWDAIVVEGSGHLMLPALYCNLKRKGLLHTLPEELDEYLEEITAINRNRNKALLRQAADISKLLSAHNIAHVFLKGIAYISSNIFSDPAERMVGDIDILVAAEAAEKAFSILHQNGYGKISGFNYAVKGHRHMDRLINDQKLAAIEIHSQFFDKKHQKLLNVRDALTNLQLKGGLPVLDDSTMYKFAALSWQINDKAYYFLNASFKAFYDCISIQRNQGPINLGEFSTSTYYKRFCYLGELYFDLFKTKPSLFKSLTQDLYKLKLNYRLFSQIGRWYTFMVSDVIARLNLFVTNGSYRKNVSRIIFKGHK